jgi:hypothetical protein
MSIRDRVAARSHTQDPAETWELPLTKSEGDSYYRSNYASYPYTPRRAEDIPSGALESLEQICAIEGLHQVFIIPWAVRSVGLRGPKVVSPNSVLTIGSRAIGLWTEKPQPGVKATIALEELAAIEDITILLYGRLSFLSFGQHLTIRYNTVARDELEPALLELRKRLAGPAQRIPRDADAAAKLPFKWNTLLHGAFARLDKSDPIVFQFAGVPRKRRHETERGQLLVLNPNELVYMCDPPEEAHQYGEDSFIVPRSRMTEVQVQESILEVTSNKARFSLSMAPALREAAARWFG